jgi:signal transduction histidine kinase
MIKQETPPSHNDIMIVDDNSNNLKLLEEMLEQQSYQVRSFPLGRLALAAAMENPPDLILLDVNMPEMNGYEVCDRLKADDKLADIPVIFLSALDGTGDKVKAFQSGAADYISKPFQLEEVQARVKAHLNMQELKRVLRMQNLQLAERRAEKEAQLIQSAKMVSLERLVSGIAHEINNPLMFVMTNLSSSNMTLQNISPDIESALTEKPLAKFRKLLVRLAEMRNGLERVKQLVLSLRTFSRLDEAGMGVVDVTASIQSVLLLLNYTMRGRITVHTQLDPECLLYCSGAKINQLLMSLITNAVEAIAETGTITISGHSIGDTFVLSVRDTGKGIRTTIMEHIFDPFFTTKKIGDGGGLGLALAYGIAQEHLGTIEVQSEEGIGSEFIVKIPLDLESRLHALAGVDPTVVLPGAI